MGIKDTIGVRRSKQQGKSVKSTPVSEGGLGLSPNENSGSIDDAIRKAKENLLAQYWYDKYEKAASAIIKGEIRGDVADNFRELQEKVNDITEDVTLLEEEVSTSDPLTPLEKKFVTLDKLAEHYRLFINRVQKQIETIGGGGLGDIADDPSPQLGGNLDLNGNDITGTGNITHTGNITTTGNNSISGTLGVSGVTTFSADDVIFTGNTSNMRWDHSTNDLILFNDTRLEFGSNKDFEIWHGGTHTFMKNSGGDLRIRGDVIKLAREDSSEKYIECNVNSSVDLYFNGSQKLATTTSGITVTGNVVISDAGNIGSASDTDAIAISSAGLVTFSGEGVSFPGQHYNILFDKATSKFKFDDDAQCVFGSASGGDMRLFHSGGNSTIKNETGQFRLAGNDIRLQTQNNSEDYIVCTDGAAVQMYHNDVEALSTTTSGIQVGASNTNATITTNGTGDLTISTNNGTDSGTIKIEDGANQNITIEPNGTGDIFLNTSGEVGIGSMSGQTIDSVVHIRDADATLTLQRIGDENTPGIIFQSNGGNARAKIYMDGTNGTNKEIVFENKVDTTMAEKFRVTLGGAKVTGNFEATGAQIDFGGLPTSNPSVAGRLWNDSGTVKVSAG